MDDTGNLIGIASLAITVIGWCALTLLALLTYRQQRLLDKRIDAFEKTIKVLIDLAYKKDVNTPEELKRITEELRACFVLIQIYGSESEIKKMKDFIDSIDNYNHQAYEKNHQILMEEFVGNLRKEVLIANKKKSAL